MSAEIVCKSGRIIRPVRVAVIDGQVVKIKRCQFCAQDLIVDRFMVHHRDIWGDADEWSPRCKTCELPFRRAYRRQNAKRINRQARAGYRRNRARIVPAVTHVGGGNLPREPFREWLVAYAKHEWLDNPTQVAEALGIVDRRIRSVMHREQPMVALDTVDAALTGARVNVIVNGVLVVTLDDLYPNVATIVNGRRAA